MASLSLLLFGLFAGCFWVEGITSEGSCQGKPYDRLKEVCCQGTIKERTYSFYSRCCGSEIYNNQKNTCCEGRLIDTERMRRPRCCGGTAYDIYKSTQVCCRNTLNDSPRSLFKRCCGKVYMDRRSHVCCDGTVVAGSSCKT